MLPAFAIAHGGGLDKNRGHHDRKKASIIVTRGLALVFIGHLPMLTIAKTENAGLTSTTTA